MNPRRVMVLVILAFFAWFIIFLPGFGCGAAVGGGGGIGGGYYVYDSCYYAGFYDYEVDNFYYIVINNYYYGTSYYYQNLDAQDTCDYYCGYNNVCYWDCLDCLYGIIDNVYLYKFALPLAQKLDYGELPVPTLRESLNRRKEE